MSLGIMGILGIAYLHSICFMMPIIVAVRYDDAIDGYQLQ